MHHGGAQGMLARGALDATADRLFQSDAVDLHVAPDGDVVDRDAGVLAEQVARALGDPDVLHHGLEDGLRRGVVLVAIEAVEAALDLWRQDLQGADIELLRDIFDVGVVEPEQVGVGEHGHAPRLRRKRRPKNRPSEKEKAIARLCQWRQPENSRKSRRKPPPRWAASSTTSPNSANLVSGLSVQRMNASSRASPSIAVPSAQKCSGRNSASISPEARCTTKAT